MPSPTVDLSVDARGVATLTLNRPEKHNALNPELIDALHASVNQLARDDSVRVVVLTGYGESFCAGGDLGWMQAQGRAPREDRITEAKRLAAMLGALDRLPRPVIARVQGAAYGGGFGILCVSDHVIIADDAPIGLTETKLGLIPATIGPYVLARLGIGTTRRMFMSGQIMRGPEVVELGLAEKSVASDELSSAVEDVVSQYLKVSAGAVAMAKNLLHDLSTDIDQSKVDLSVSYLADCWETDHAQDGIKAFFAARERARHD